MPAGETHGHRHAEIGRPSTPVLVAGVAYLALWIGTAIAPFDRSAWLLENVLVAAFVAVLAVTYRRFRFSTASYLLMIFFLTLHAVGAYYTYSEMPLGFLVQESWGLSRNHYDRLAHLSFGVLFALPAKELVSRRLYLPDRTAGFPAFVVILASSTTYELVEWCVALLVSPEASHAYLGTQGDMFDAQKDTALAAAGAATMLVVHRLWSATRP